MYAKYRQFVELKDAGRKQEANAAAEKLVAEFWEDPDDQFIADVCDDTDHKLNHHIWSGIVLPYYLSNRSDPRAIKCLIQTIQNLYSDKPSHKRLDWISEEKLVDQLLEKRPDDEWAISKKKDVLSRWLAYTIHEWPSGVLYGVDGATLEQCDEILEAVAELRELDAEAKFASLCKDVAKKTMLYRERLHAAGSDA